MDWLMISLRMVHILSGVFWAGATFVFASHITPAVKATGQEGQKFMAYLAGQGKISNALGIAGILAVLTGLTMYFLQGWYLFYATSSAVVLGFGIVLGIVAYLHGAFVQRKAILELQSLGRQIAASGQPPGPDQAAELNRLAAKVERNGKLLAYMLGLTVVAMGAFQYF